MQFAAEGCPPDMVAAPGFERETVAVNDPAVGIAYETVQRRHVHAGEIGIDANKVREAITPDTGDEHAA